MITALEFRHVSTIALGERDHLVDIAMHAQGTLMAVAFPSSLKVFAFEKQILPALEGQEVWTEMATYNWDAAQSKISGLSWATPDLLCVAFNSGYLVLGDLCSKPLNGFQTMNLSGRQASQFPVKFATIEKTHRFMAVVAGKHEVCIWRFSMDDEDWIPSYFLPEYSGAAGSEEALEVVSVHWDNYAADLMLIIAYSPETIVNWAVHPELAKVELVQEAMVKLAMPGCLSPDGKLYVHGAEGGGYNVFDVKVASDVVPFRVKNDKVPVAKLSTPRFMFGGDWLLGCGDSSIYLWHVDSRQLVRKFSVDGNGPVTVSKPSVCGVQCDLNQSNSSHSLKFAVVATRQFPPRQEVMIWRGLEEGSCREEHPDASNSGDTCPSLIPYRGWVPWVFHGMLVAVAVAVAMITWHALSKTNH